MKTISNTKEKHLYAGLFNTALNNFDLSISEVSKRIFKKEYNEKSFFEKVFKDDSAQLNVDNAIKFLSESLVWVAELLPFFNKLKKENQNDLFIKDKTDKQIYEDFLTEMYKLVEGYRNFYTHYEHPKIEVPDIVADFLNHLLVSASKESKKERAKSPQIKDMIRSNEDYKKIIAETIENKNKKLEENYAKNLEKFNKGELDKKPRFIEVINNDKGYDFVMNTLYEYFYTYIKDDPKPSLNIKLCENNELTDDGFIFLINLFTEKRQSHFIFEKIEYYNKEVHKLQKEIIRWVYTHYSYRSIRYLFRSDYDNDSLLLQMVSELGKCPDELYPLLSEMNRNEFIEDINIYLKEVKTFTDEDLVVHPVIKKRYDDKFPYFAIRFLDAVRAFPNLRFAVNVGKFHHDTMDKTFGSTKQTTTRSIFEKLVVFEKLHLVAQKKNEYITNLKTRSNKPEDSNLKTDWVEYPRPQYQFFENNIAIWLPIKDLEINKEIPKREQKPDKKQLLDMMNLGNAYKKPIAYLSFNELPALLYTLLVEKKTESDIENIITGKIKKHIEQINHLNKETTDFKHSTSRKLKRYDNDQGDYDWEDIKEAVSRENSINPLENIRKYYDKKTKEPETLSNDIKTKEPETLSNDIKTKEPEILSNAEKGKIATWLSKDIKRFVKTQYKKDWKGFQFAEFQALLSFYDKDRLKVKLFLENELKINKPNTMLLFDGLDFDLPTLYEFYDNYLKKRVHYLNTILDNMKSGDYPEEYKLPFNISRFKIPYIEEYKKTLLENPFMLPRGVFDVNPTFVKGKNSTFVKAKWFEMAENYNVAQEFFRYSRMYPIDDEVKQTIVPSKKSLKEQYIPKSKPIQKEIYKSELHLRKLMRNDFYVLQMIKNYLKTNTDVNQENLEKVTLKDFYSTKKEKQTDRSGQFNDVHILSQKIELNLLGGKLKGEVELKESSKYRKFTQDARVQQLVQYSDKVWTFEEIFLELDDYDVVRGESFFQKVHGLEKDIFAKAQTKNETNELLEKGFPNFKRYLAYAFIDNQKDKDTFNAKPFKSSQFNEIIEPLRNLYLLVLIRNKFSHNQLLPTEVYHYITEKYPNTESLKIGRYMDEVFKRITNQFLTPNA